MTARRTLSPVPDPPYAAELARLAMRVRQLEAALEGRAAIECARGILMERHDLDQRAAFELLRRTARSRNLTVGAVARSVVAARPEPDRASRPEGQLVPFRSTR